MMPLKTIGRNIRAIRKAQNMSIDDLAFHSGLSRNYIAMVERGERNPTLKSFLQIVNALKVSADEVLCDVLESSCKNSPTPLVDKIENLSPQRRDMIYDLLNILQAEEGKEQ